MKITDKEILLAVWRATVHRLPYKATHHYVGNLRGLAPADEYWHQSATEICSVFREAALDLPLSKGQSLRRIKALIERNRLVVSGRRPRPGEGFHFKLPDSLTLPAFNLTQKLLREYGMTEKNFLPDHGYAEIAQEVSIAVESEIGPLVEQYVRRCARQEEVTL
ncbi:hypothetical protein G6E34_003786 [Salmonella enterica subsp. diarizonae]|nr:hypothetical protein [Salmonella enterica]EBE9032987.1 hypothetical protein [Salmonella enterica]EBE9065151.1 hypothetical protein [Salmonella enterica]EEO7476542.1 hypothetical protein [Salmonella enterica subsp. diarizonae]EGV3636334.1 hypothetical protein [Salmonella enterica]